MKAFRMGCNTTEHYSSFEEAARAWNCKPVNKKIKNEEKLNKLQEKFNQKPKHKCKACGEPLTYIGGNMLTCTNEKCKGIKVEKEDADGKKIVTYVTSYFLLDEKDAEFANVIFQAE